MRGKTNIKCEGEYEKKKINLRYILKTEWIRVRGTNIKWPSSKTACFNVWRRRNPIQSVGKAERHLWCLFKSFPFLALFINDIPKVSTDEEYLYFLNSSAQRHKKVLIHYNILITEKISASFNFTSKAGGVLLFSPISAVISCHALYFFSCAQDSFSHNYTKVLLSLATPFTIFLSCWKWHLPVLPHLRWSGC